MICQHGAVNSYCPHCDGWPQDKMPVRIQITCYSQLVAEAVLESSAEADKLWARWASAKYRVGKPIGGAAIQRADLPRIWGCRVGERI